MPGPGGYLVPGWPGLSWAQGGVPGPSGGVAGPSD